MLFRYWALIGLLCLNSATALADDDCSQLQSRFRSNEHDIETAQSASRASQQHIHDLKARADWLLQKANASKSAADWNAARDAQSAFEKARLVEVNWIATDSAAIGRLVSENAGVRALLKEKGCLKSGSPQIASDATCDRTAAENAVAAYVSELGEKLPGKPEDRDPDDQAWIDMNLEPLADRGTAAIKDRDWNSACAAYRKALAVLITRTDLPRHE
jgi:hypothetical protein